MTTPNKPGLAIMTSGGDSAGMNPAIKCAVEYAAQRGYEPFLIYDGLIKNAAINTYIIAVAPYEPDPAGQWALTLPAGPSRDGNLRIVYRDWLKKDPVAAAAFAEKHGIK